MKEKIVIGDVIVLEKLLEGTFGEVFNNEYVATDFLWSEARCDYEEAEQSVLYDKYVEIKSMSPDELYDINKKYSETRYVQKISLSDYSSIQTAISLDCPIVTCDKLLADISRELGLTTYEINPIQNYTLKSLHSPALIKERRSD